jgi:Ca2+-binding EF-hand superfamily protein
MFRGNPQKFCEFAFPAIDKNKNGKIDFTEFMTAVALTHPGNLETRLRLVCNRIIYWNRI